MSLKIYAPKDHLLTWKALIAAKYAKVEIELTPEFVMGTDNKTPEFLQKNPLGKVPVMETPEGCIWESNAIARYVCRLDENSQLLGSDAYENALVEQWIDFASLEINLPCRVWLYPIWGLMPNNPEATNKAKGDIRKVLDLLNKHLADQTFLVGERVTLADIVVGISLLKLFSTVLDNGFRKAFQNTMRWFTTCVNQPEWQEVVGEFTFCTKMAVAPKSDQEKKAKEEQEKKKKEQQEKQKQEKHKKKEKKEKDDEEEEEEEEIYREPKSKNPLDDLPPSKMVMDEWKRMYSNNDGDVAMPWFWEHFDKEGFSLWKSTYKYNDELESTLKTCNLIGGYHQRLIKMMKYGFANNLILQSPDKNHLEIEGHWLIRGQEMPQLMVDVVDFEYYDFVKLNSDDEKVRKDVEESWNWEGNFDGRTFVAGKNFK